MICWILKRRTKDTNLKVIAKMTILTRIVRSPGEKQRSITLAQRSITLANQFRR